LSFNREECNFNPLCVITENDLEPRLEPQDTNPMQQIGNINVLNIDNLFTNESPSDLAASGVPGKLSYNNYCAVTQDFGTHHMDEEALRVLESFGYPRALVMQSINQGELNHATTTYNLLVTA